MKQGILLAVVMMTAACAGCPAGPRAELDPNLLPLRNPDTKERHEAARKLAAEAERSDGLFDALVRAAGDKDHRTRQGAMDALLSVDPAARPAVVGALTATLMNPDARVRSAAALDLMAGAVATGDYFGNGRKAMERARLDMARLRTDVLLTHEDKDIRMAAMFHEGEPFPWPRISPGDLDRLVDAMGDPREEVSAGACATVGSRGYFHADDVGCRAALLRGLANPRPLTRSRAAGMLGCLFPRDTTLVAPLTALLKDPALQVRFGAAQGLGDMAATALPALPLLKALASSDPSPIVRQCAAESIEAIAPAPKK